MYNGNNINFPNNKELNSIQHLSNDDLFYSNSIQIPKQINKHLLEEGSSENDDEPDASVIHSVSSDSGSNNSKENQNEKKEINSIFDFENIELPKEEEVGEFRIISDFKIETLDGKNKTGKKKGIKPIKLEEEFEIEEDEDSEEKLEPWDLLKILILTKSKKSKGILGKFKHILSNIIYNYKSFSEKLNKSTARYPLNLFDSKTNSFIDINNSIFSFIYMSYRSGFFNMNYLGIGDCTSDSGWGCMLRCCQMMLSRGFIKLKLKENLNNSEKNNKIIIDNSKNNIINIKKEILNLFYDGKLPYNKVRSNLYLTHFFQLYQQLADINGFETNISEIIPPYSIYTLCYLGNCKGIYTSDIRMIKCFLKINELLFDSLIMIHFENGHVSKKDLIEKFLLINNIKKDFEFNNIYKYNKKDYKFNKPGLIFISFRLGLQNLDESYYNIIPLIFSKIHNNIGFVSGKKNRAYYFIGCNGDGKIIFVDPHFNQKVEDNDKLLSYNIQDLFLLNIKELSGELTLGIAISNLDDFKILMNDLEYLCNNFPNFITLK